jgi:hypothetical protein
VLPSCICCTFSSSHYSGWYFSFSLMDVLVGFQEGVG